MAKAAVRFPSRLRLERDHGQGRGGNPLGMGIVDAELARGNRRNRSDPARLVGGRLNPSGQQTAGQVEAIGVRAVAERNGFLAGGRDG